MAFVKKRSPQAKTWSVVYDYKDEKGVTRKKWESGYKTQKLANARKAEIENAMAQNSFIAPSTVTVKELFDKVIDVYGTRKWEPKTYELNESLIRNHIVPEIGASLVQQVTPLQIEELFTSLKKKQVMRGKGSDRPCLSGTTLRHIHVLLKQGFRLAVEWDLLHHNPVKMDPPQRTETEASIWTPDVMYEALEEMKQCHAQLYLAAHTAYVCAMRIGEAVGLRWSRVDFENDLITVDKTLQRVKKSTLEALAQGDDEIFVFPGCEEEAGSVLVLKKPKTRGSNRTIHMPPILKHDLLMRKQLVAKEKAFHGRDYQDYDLVFCMEDGRPVEPKRCDTWFKKFQKRSESGYPKLKFHEIRHSIATLLVILSGGNPATVQKVTGHQTPDILLRKYNHATTGMVNELSERFEDIFYAHKGDSLEALQKISAIPQKQLSTLVSQFDQTCDYGPVQSQMPAAQLADDEDQTILQALADNPELKEMLLSALSMQTMHTMQRMPE